MNRKNSNLKQLQAECKKRDIGFMTSWTKMALIKRLEDEDKRDKKVNDLSEKLNQSKIDVREKDKKLHSIEPKEVERKVILQLKKNKIISLDAMKKQYDVLDTKQQIVKKEMISIGDKKLILLKEIDTLKDLIKSL